MATHSSVLAWRIPGTGEPGGLPSLGSQSRTRLKRLSSSSSSSNSIPSSKSIPRMCYLVRGKSDKEIKSRKMDCAQSCRTLQPRGL